MAKYPRNRNDGLYRYAGSYKYRSYLRTQNGYVQSPLSSEKNPYTSDVFYQVITNSRNGEFAGTVDGINTSFHEVTSDINGRWAPLESRARSKLERFVNETYGNVNVGAAIFAEGRESAAAIVKSAGQLIGAFRSLKGGRWRQFYNHMLGIFSGRAGRTTSRSLTPPGLTPRQRRWFDRHMERTKARLDARRRWAKSRYLSENWLAFSFGWAPLVQDIHDAAHLIFEQRDVTYPAEVSTSSSWSKNTSSPWTTVDHVLFVKIGCDLRVTNENLAHLNQLGLINPAAVAWEAVPFSFMVDWFVNVGEVLGSFSQFAGLQVLNPSTTRFVRTTFSGSRTYSSGGLITSTSAGQRFQMNRRLAFPSPPSLRWKWSGFTPERAANAIALLVQSFLKP